MNDLKINPLQYCKLKSLVSLEAIFFQNNMQNWAAVIYELTVVRGFHRNTKGKWSKVWTKADQLNLIETGHHIYDDPMFRHMVWHY